MCKHSYQKKSEQTGKVMIFCKLKEKDTTLSNLCISQRYCANKDKYVVINQKRDCKHFEE